jgi:ParB family chromosome partitioning protein
MGKLDELMKTSASIAAESMGAGRIPAPMHRASTPPAVPTVPDRMAGLTRSKNAAEIPLARIVPDHGQPREEFDGEAIRRLAESLKSRGQLQPIRVRWDEAMGRYVIVCGERRWRAAGLAGLPTMTAIIMDAPVTPAELRALQLIENCAREDLRPIEQAKAFRSLMDSHGWSTRRLANELAITQSGIVRALSLLDLPSPVQERVEQGDLAPATAYELSKVEDPAARAALAERVVGEDLSRAEAVEAVRKVAGRAKGRGASKGKARARRLPAELKHRGAGGNRILVRTTARATLADVAADLEAFAARLRAPAEDQTRDAA